MSWQDILSRYFEAAYSHSAGDYRGTRLLLRRAAADASAATETQFSTAFRTIADIAAGLNTQLLEERNASAEGHRHPRYDGPHPLTLEDDEFAFDRVHDFYSVGIEALRPTPPANSDLRMIRKAILSNYVGDEDRTARRIRHRFERRRGFAKDVLKTRELSSKTTSDVAIKAFVTAGLDGEGWIPAFLLSAFFQAHINRYNVEHDRSVPTGIALAKSHAELEAERAQLQQSVALLTFTFAVCLNCPWVFAEHKDERAAIMNPVAGAPRVDTDKARWLARQLLLLSIYRRAHVFRLLGEHGRSYNDLRKVQRMSRVERLGLSEDDPKNLGLNTLEMLAEYRIGELYRADHDASQALVHLCRSHDLVRDHHKKRPDTIKESALFQVHIRLSKGKAFLEVGAVKRALKWFVRAWISLQALIEIATASESESVTEAEAARSGTDAFPGVAELDRFLDDVKHAPELAKVELLDRLDAAVEELCRRDLRDRSHDALIADVLIRIAHVLLVLRLDPGGRSAHAEDLLKRAVELDDHNLLSWTGLLRCELRGMSPFELDAPNAMECWPSGTTDVDQAIRTGEYLMLKRVRDAALEAGEDLVSAVDVTADNPDIPVARALLNHFHTHTDSINLRLGILHRYLMQPRADEVQKLEALPEGRSADEPMLEFVCLRRYGSFHPLMPRPAAVSAVGGGYLVQVFAPRASKRDGKTERAFNVLIDPGDGVINNLYRAGLAISDVDMAIVTHDHPDHLAALDAILSLRHEQHENLRDVMARGGNVAKEKGSVNDDLRQTDDTGERMLILGNQSVVNRYSYLNGGRRCVVMHIDDASAQACPQLVTRRLVISSLPNHHRDLGGHHAVGFVLGLKPKGAKTPLKIAFMSDTTIRGVGAYKDGRLEIDGEREDGKRWLEALGSHIVVAHLSDTPSGELRQLAEFPPVAGEDGVRDFDAAIAGLLQDRQGEAMQLMHALSLMPPRSNGNKPADPPLGLLDSGFLATMKTWTHLYLHGLLAVAKHIEANEVGPRRLLVVGELREQLGSFRGTIAREINRHVFRAFDDKPAPGSSPPPRNVALTADIGLRIRLTATHLQQVHCSTCALNNDRLASERYHPSQEIREVCVKGDHEAMYWNCLTHDPSNREPAVFVEQMGGYDPFTAGGRFHG